MSTLDAPPAPGFRRMQIVEVSDDEDDEPVSNGPCEPQQASLPTDPFPDVQVESSVQGIEKAKERANALFAEGKTSDAERWFSKAIWMATESGKVREAPASLLSVLHSNRAFARLRLKQWPSTEEDCTKALSLNSGNAKALYRRAMARFELKKRAGALEDVEKLLPMLASGMDQEAKELKQKILALPSDKEAVPPKPASPKASPKAASAEPLPELKFEQTRAGVEQAKSKGSKVFSQGDFAAASQHFTKALWLMDSGLVSDAKSDPSWAQSTRIALFSNRAFAEMKQEHWAAAEDDCNASLQLDPQAVKALYRRAMAREKLGRAKEALQDVEEALRLQPDAQELQSLRARLDSEGFRRIEIVEREDEDEKQQEAAKKPESATPSPKATAQAQASEPPPGFRRMQIVEASDDEEEEEPPKAAAPKEASPKAESEPFPALKFERSRAGVEQAKNKGSKAFAEGDFAAASQHFTKALWLMDSGEVPDVKSDTSWAQATRVALYSNRAFSEMKQEHWQQAEDDCNESLKLNPKAVKAFYRRAMAREKLGRAQQALEDAEEALKLQPDAQELQTLHARLSAKPKAPPEPASGFRRMEIVEASDDEEEEAPKKAEPAQPSPKASPQATSEPPPGFRRMQIVEASDDEDEDEPPKMNGHGGAPELAAAGPAAADPPPGFRRLQIQEASDDEDDAPSPTSAPPKAAAPKVPSPKQAPPKAAEPAEPYPDIQVEISTQGLEKVKQRANGLFAEGKTEESERCFSKAIWVAESGKLNAPKELQSVLHSNRAYARLKLKKWAAAEEDCTQALTLNAANAKAFYRRAQARVELRNRAGGLEDIEKLLPLLAHPGDKEALDLKKRLEALPLETKSAEVSASEPPPGYKRLEIVEASDDEDEEPPKMSNGASTPNGSAPASPVKAETKATAKPPSPKAAAVATAAEPFPELKFECSRQGIEQAKAAGSKAFARGDCDSASKHFSKGLWLLDQDAAEVKSDESWATATRLALYSNRAFAEMRMGHWQATEDDCNATLQLSPEADKPLARRALYRRALAREQLGRPAEALKDVQAALKAQPEAQDLRVLHDRLVKSAAQEAPPDAKSAVPKKAPADAKPAQAKQAPAPVPKPSEAPKGPPEPYADIKIEYSVAGVEKAKEEGNRLFAAGKTEECERRFSAAIWVAEESGKLKDAPKELLSILHSNRAYARLKLKKWTDAEEDCTKALALNSSNTKALYRRAQARAELPNRAGGLEDLEKLLPQLVPPGDKDALELRKRLQALPDPQQAIVTEASQPLPGFKRLEIVEASDDEDEEEPPKAGQVPTPNGSSPTSPAKAEAKVAAPAEPFPELKFERSRQGVELAKAAGSRAFTDGDFDSASKFFSKGLWLMDQAAEATSDVSWAVATRAALHSNRAFAEMKLEHWQASEDDCTAALELNPEAVKPLYRRALVREKLGRKAEALKDAEAALKGQPDSQDLQSLCERLAKSAKEVATPPGFKRMEIVEASDSEDEPQAPPDAKPGEPRKAPAETKSAAAKQAPVPLQPGRPQAPPEPFPDIKLEYSVNGAEKAKEEGNRLFSAGNVEESARWFSKAIWLVEESGKLTGVTATLRAILYSNRAFARLKLRQWAEAEADCSKALSFNVSNPKALYRRAMARKELEKYDAALADLDVLLPLLDPGQNKDAVALQEELRRLLPAAKPQAAPAAPVPGKNSPPPAKAAPAEPLPKPASPAPGARPAEAMSFAQKLTKIVGDKREEDKSREKLAEKWRAHEAILIEKLVDTFKKKCLKEAELERCEASISFASLVGEIDGFPTQIVVDSQQLVDNWGDGAASWWYYAHRGLNHEFVNGSPVAFKELLESMMPKFLESLQDLGFQSCKREPGTWKVVASWQTPEK